MDHTAVLFDLDGTLIDTAPDLGAALNNMLRSRGHDALDLDQIRPWVSRGSGALVELGFGLTAGDPEFDGLRQEFLDFYGQNVCVHSKPFIGIPELLAVLDQRRIAWGIVTNKPHAYTVPLLEQLTLPATPHTIVSGDSLRWKKPHPGPLLHAMQSTGTKPASSFYIGDDERDIVAARNAGMRSIAVGYGYTPPGQRPQRWGADYFVSTSADLGDLLIELLDALSAEEMA